jgi:hypothetical protein
MGYFSNGSEGDDYWNAHCRRCVHWHHIHGCPCWSVHEWLNYDECNKPDSALHYMIPLDEKHNNKQCIYWAQKPEVKNV